MKDALEKVVLAMVRAAREPLLVLDAELRVKTASPAFYQTFQFTPETVAGAPLTALGGEQWSHPRLAAWLQELADSSLPFEGMEIDDDDPRVGHRVLRLGASLLSPSDLILVTVEVMSEDQDCRESEESLRESEERYRKLVEFSPDGIAVHSGGRVIYANASAVRLFGATSSLELIGRPVTAFVHPEDLPVALARAAETQSEGAIAPLMQERFVRLDGQVLDVEVMGVGITDRGKPATLLIIRDIARRKQAEDALHQSESRNQAVVNAIPDLMFRISRDGIYLDYHAPSEEDLIAPPDQFLGRRLSDVMSPDLAGQWMNVIGKALDTRHVQTFEYPLSFAGQTRFFEARVINSGRDEVLALVRNVAERRQAEAQALELALEREKIQLLKRFIGEISHDLKNPIAALKNTAYVLDKYIDRLGHEINAVGDEPAMVPARIAEIDRLTTGMRERINLAKDSSARLNRLVENMLEMIRLDSYTGFAFAPHDLNQLAARIVQIQRGLALEKNLLMVFEPQPGLPQVSLDEDQFSRVAQNLIENAVHYTSEGGQVTVRTYQSGDRVALEVKDTGIGIDEADLPHIFDRFYRADLARSTHTGGAGLGLAITKKIVESHRGSIEVESIPARGSTFRVLLPTIAPNGTAENPVG